MSTPVIFWIAVGAIAIIAFLIYAYEDNVGIDDFDDIVGSFIEGVGWIIVLSIIGIGAIIYGFVFWIWWIMLIIVLGVAVIAVVVWLITHNRSYRYKETGEIENKVVKTKYKCENCGANISKIITGDGYGGERIIYKCDYCGITYDENDDYNEDEEDGGDEYDDEEITLTDFEEEYFNACEKFFYKPYNEHSASRIENKYKELCARLKHGTIYEDSDDAKIDEIDLVSAYNFFKEQESEIEDYFLDYDEDEIKSRYEYYLENYE